MKQIISSALLILVTAGCAGVPTRGPAGSGATALSVSKLYDTSLLAAATSDSPTALEIAQGGALLVGREGTVVRIDGETRIVAELPNLEVFQPAGEQLVAYTDGALVRVGASGELDRLLEIELEDVHLAGDERRVFVVGVRPSGESTVLAHVHGQGSQHLLELPRPVDSVAVDSARLYLTMGPLILSVEPGRPVAYEAALPGFDRITSLAVAAQGDVIYFSDGSAVYALRRGLRPPELAVLLSDVGGEVRTRGDSLVVLSTDLEGIYEIRGMTNVLRSDGHPALVRERSRRSSTSAHGEGAAGPAVD